MVRREPKRSIFSNACRGLAAHILRFDGGSRGNPGNGGAGAIIGITSDIGEVDLWSGQFWLGENCTNNRAEYVGLVFGLKKAVELGVQELEVQGDSLLIVKQMTGEYRVSSDNLKPLHQLARGLANQIPKISFKHISRSQNGRADALVNKALDTQQSEFYNTKEMT